MDINMYKKVGACISIFAIILLTACGNMVNQGTVLSTQEEVYDWQSEGFVIEDMLEENPLFTVDYKTIEYTKPENTLASEFSQPIYGNDFYILDNHYTSQGTVYEFQMLGTEAFSRTITLDPKTWGISEGNILGMDVVDTEQCVFWVTGASVKDDNNRHTTEHYYVVYTDHKGELLKYIDIIDTLKEQGIWENAPIAYVGTQINCDAQGNIYIRDGERHSIYVLNGDGKMLTRYVYQGEDGANIIHSFRTDNGEVIFVCESGDKLQFVWLNPEDGTEKQLAITDWEYILKWYGMNQNEIYYATEKQLIGWNIATGEKEILLKMDENEIADVISTSFVSTEDGRRLLVTTSDRRYILTLSEEEPERKGDIVIANICEENSFLKGRVFSFSRENPLYGIGYEEAYQTEEDISRVLMEVANGKGPDVLYVSREDMESLHANGALGNLKKMLSTETYNVLLPGVIDMGTYDNKLLGVPLSVTIRTMITNREYWQENTWTIRDVLTLLDEQKEAKGIFIDYFGQDTFYYNMFFMVGIDIENVPYLADAENGFDSAEFQELLRQVQKRTGKVSSMNSLAEFAEALKKGEILGIEANISNMQSFATAYDKIGQYTCFVGYPTETGNGNYMETCGMIVVNQNAMEKAGVKELIDYLFSTESQQLIRNEISVRWDIPENQLKYDEAREQYFWTYPEGRNDLVPEKYDGTSYLEEYVNFIKSAVPYSVSSSALFDIVMEEADSYFYSDKDINEVTKAIQSRVQLYLEEQKTYNPIIYN